MNPSHGESTAIEQRTRTTEDRRLKRLKPPDENLQEAGGGGLSTLGDVTVFNADPDPLGVAAMVENVNAGGSRALIR